MIFLNRIESDKRFLNNSKGFTIVEMLVVLGIFSLMLVLGLDGMFSARKQNEVLAAAREFQSNIRLIANNSISVASDLENTNKPTKAWALSIRNNDSRYFLNSYSDDAGIIVDSNKPKITVLNEISISVENTATTLTDNDYIILVFSSPFAKFTGVKTAGMLIPPVDPSEDESYQTYSSIEGWNAPAAITKEVTPNSISPQTVIGGRSRFTFTNGNANQNVTVSVDHGTGESTIE